MKWKYLIRSTDTNKFRTKTGWISDETQLFDMEIMLSFDSRDIADVLIKKKGFRNCESYGINENHPLYKHC